MSIEPTLDNCKANLLSTKCVGVDELHPHSHSPLSYIGSLFGTIFPVPCLSLRTSSSWHKTEGDGCNSNNSPVSSPPSAVQVSVLTSVIATSLVQLISQDSPAFSEQHSLNSAESSLRCQHALVGCLRIAK